MRSRTMSKVTMAAVCIGLACAMMGCSSSHSANISTNRDAIDDNKRLIDDAVDDIGGNTANIRINRRKAANNEERISDVVKDVHDLRKQIVETSRLQHDLNDMAKDVAMMKGKLHMVVNTTNDLTQELHLYYIRKNPDSPEANLLNMTDAAAVYLDNLINPMLVGGWSCYLGALVILLVTVSRVCALWRVGAWQTWCGCWRWCGKPFLPLRKFGRHLVILSFYTWDSLLIISGNYCIVWSLVFILISSWFFHCLDTTIDDRRRPQRPQLKKLSSVEDFAELLPRRTKAILTAHFDSMPDMKEVRNVYQDLARPTWQVILVFLTQLGLVAFFVDALILDSKLHQMSGEVNMVRWLFAVFFQITWSERQAGERNYGVWRTLLNRIEGNSDEDQDQLNSFESIGKYQRRLWGSCGAGFTHLLKRQWWLRRMLDVVVNAICRDLVLYTLPIMLSTMGPREFVYNCTAVFFILTLDDISPVSLNEIAVKLKFRELLKQTVKDPDAKLTEYELTKHELAYANNPEHFRRFDRFETYFGEAWLNFRSRGGEDTV